MSRADADLLDLMSRDPATGHASWDPTLTRRLRVLLHLEPLLRLRASDTRRDPDLRHYDSLVLAVRALDVIAQQMGMEREATAAGVLSQLAPLLRGMDEAALVPPDPARHRRIVDRILGALRNDDDAHRPFTAHYLDPAPDGSTTERVLRFRLVEDAFGLDGHPVLRLSPTAINLLFSALELDIEDAQAATEAIVQSQVRRGQFLQAARTARNALHQSQAYQVRIQRLLRETRRDVHRVDWRDQVPRLLDEALHHIEERVAVESTIRASARERLDHLQPGSAEALQVVEIADLISRCIDTHTGLQRALLGARAGFLDSQARQAFVPHARRVYRSLYHDLLEPLLSQPARDAEAAVRQTPPTVLGPRPPRALSLLDLADGLLSPRIDRNASQQLAPDVEPEAALDERPRYHPDDVRRAASALASVDTPTPLGAIAAALEATGHQDAAELVALLALAAWDPDDDTRLAWRVETARDDDGHPRLARYGRRVGHELVVVPGAAHPHDRAPTAAGTSEDSTAAPPADGVPPDTTPAPAASAPADSAPPEPASDLPRPRTPGPPAS